MAVLGGGAPPGAQKVASRFHEVASHGFRFKPVHEWQAVPVETRLQESGVVCRMDGRPLATQVGNAGVVPVRPGLHVFHLEDPPPEVEGVAVDHEDRSRARPERTRWGELVPAVIPGLDGFEVARPVEHETRRWHGMDVEHLRWSARQGSLERGFPLTLDAWRIPLADRDVCFLFDVPEQHERKWNSVFERVVKSFEPIERHPTTALDEGAGYEELLTFHAEEAARTPGWRALPTPSRKFIVKTSSDDERFVEAVIERLEQSREVFEHDFPPEAAIREVSVVRICSSAEEFQLYGNTRRGVAGWFSPTTKELVLYDNLEIDRNVTYAVMTHEAFHQYCHFLFGESEANRWFDEGHGDYYGGMEFRARDAVVTARMPAGLSRIDVVKQMVREGSYAPLAEHLRYDHRQWQSQGSGHEGGNVFPYAQSWSIVFMLRQGAEGKVNRRVWRDEYAGVIPAYVASLARGFVEARAELQRQREREAAAQGVEVERIEPLEVDEERRQAIWRQAFDDSWGRIDLAQFEEDWVQYVRKYLRD